MARFRTSRSTRWSFDTTVQSLSGLGAEPALLLASRGDTLDTRVIIRFDSTADEIHPDGDTAQAIKTVDSAYIRLRVDTLSIKGDGPFTIEAYDVDTTANDTSSAAVIALFRPDRLISSQDLGPDGSARTPRTTTFRTTAVLAKLQSGAQLRVGLRVTGPTSSQIRIFSVQVGLTPLLFFRATPDTATKPLLSVPFSRTPTSDPIVAGYLNDYTVVVKGPPPAPPSVLAVGGLPPRRTYLRFDIPSNIVDSTTVVRATLLLNQIPIRRSIRPTAS